MSANDKQVGGDHYKGKKVQHWDFVYMHNLDYFQGQITKYVVRWRDKGGLEDLHKAQHYLEKYLELLSLDANIPARPSDPEHSQRLGDAGGGYVDQD